MKYTAEDAIQVKRFLDSAQRRFSIREFATFWDTRSETEKTKWVTLARKHGFKA